MLRALLPGRPTRDTLFGDVLRDGKSVMKVRGEGVERGHKWGWAEVRESKVMASR